MKISELKNAPQWLIDAKTSEEDVTITPQGCVIWHDGTWLGGTWLGGTWHDGIWLGGTWLGGEWHYGEWLGGEWHKGIWLGGEWHDGEWLGGEWHKGIWYDGLWYGGVWYDGVWHGGEWLSGIWHGGTWHGGVWIDGHIDDGTWRAYNPVKDRDKYYTFLSYLSDIRQAIGDDTGRIMLADLAQHIAGINDDCQRYRAALVQISNEAEKETHAMREKRITAVAETALRKEL